MKNSGKIIIILLIVIISASFVSAGGISPFLNNGFQALFYHAVRIEDTFKGLNPMGLAREAFENALRSGDESGEANIMLGMIYQYLDRPGTALGYYLDFAAEHPDEVWVYSLIGDMYTDMGLYDDAKRNYSIAVEKAEEDQVFSQAHLGLGNIAFMQGEYLQAKEAFEHALTDSGDLLDAWLSLGKSLYYLEEYDEAIETLEKAQQLAPHYSPVFYYLGLSYDAAGYEERAKHAFERVEKLNFKGK